MLNKNEKKAEERFWRRARKFAGAVITVEPFTTLECQLYTGGVSESTRNKFYRTLSQHAINICVPHT